jgi:hypothetical protein
MEYNEAVHQLFTDFKKGYNSGKREVLCTMITEFGIPRKLVVLIKISLNETYSTVWEGMHFSDVSY